ncbi:hypothetical protein FACS189473_5530 [Spirochaetia bacterium]|nr:hypothetical protein FACS189473_5530 [Spirochaetia bacterium]
MFVLGDGTAAGSAAVMGALRLFKGKPEIIRNRALMTLDEAWYADAERHIGTWTSKDAVNQATLKRFGKRWVRNLAANMESIRDLPGVGRLAGVLRTCAPQACGDIPVLLAAAGPSLDGIVPYLPALAERCVVAAVDTSLNLLLKAGVDPDFALVVDPQYWNVRHLDRAKAPKTCLVAESAVYPSALRGFLPQKVSPSAENMAAGAAMPYTAAFERAYLCGSVFPLGRFIEERVDPKGSLGTGGSVATTAWDFARLLGASSIWIAGLDLSFPGLKTHFKGALFENRALAESGRLDPAETRSVRALRDGLPFSAPSAEGGTVLTDRRLSLYAAWFENRFRLYPNLRNYSFSAGGLAIPGLIPAKPEDLLALPPPA